MCLYEKNIKYLQENYDYIKLEDVMEDDVDIKIEENIYGQKYITIENEGYTWRFDSMYKPDEAARCWCKQFQNVNYRTVFVILGIGNGEQIKELNEQYPENIKIICEPNQNLFVELLKIRDIKTILNEKSFVVAGKKCSSIFAELIDKIVTYDNRDEIKFSIIPNYNKVNKKQCIEYKNFYKNRIERLIVARNTFILDEKTRAYNYLNNMLVYPECSSIGQLIEAFNDIDLSDRIGIVVAAGPSLDKNIHLLKQVKNKAFIIAVDTALKSVISSGVKPDMAIIIDPEKDPKLFEDKIIKKLPMSVTVHANNDVLKKHEGRMFFAGGDKEFIKSLSIKFHKSTEVIYSGGSVSTNAFVLLALLGFKKIVLIGQDLAYPNGQIHAKDAYNDEEKIDMSSRYFEVEDIYGGKVYTEGNMDMYRRWYEEMIVSNPEYTVIDATEGGAKINGSQIMTLQQVIDQYIKGNSDINYEKIINDIPKLYTEDEKEKLYDYYDSIEGELNSLKRKLEEAISDYELLIEKEVNGQQKELSYKQCANRIIESVKKIEDNVFLEWCRLYDNYIDYNVLDEINDTSVIEESESLKAARGGKTICEVYIKSLERVLEEWKGIYNENNTHKRKTKLECNS